MKKFIVIILLLSLPMTYLVVTLRNHYVSKNISSAEEAPTKDDVYIDMQIQKYGYKSNLGEEIFEIPLFVSKNGDNKEIDKLNGIIAPLLNYYNGNYGFKQDEDTIEIKSYPFTDDSYLQVITTAIIYPNYKTQGDVYSYNYDIKNEKILTLDDAYLKDNKNKSELINNIKNTYDQIKLDKNSICTSIEIKGFLIRNNSINYFVNLLIANPDFGDYNVIFTYNSSTNDLKEYNGSCLINPDEVDNFQPELTYKRFDIMEKYYENNDNIYIK